MLSEEFCCTTPISSSKDVERSAAPRSDTSTLSQVSVKYGRFLNLVITLSLLSLSGGRGISSFNCKQIQFIEVWGGWYSLISSVFISIELSVSSLTSSTSVLFDGLGYVRECKYCFLFSFLLISPVFFTSIEPINIFRESLWSDKKDCSNCGTCLSFAQLQFEKITHLQLEKSNNCFDSSKNALTFCLQFALSERDLYERLIFWYFPW